MSKEKIIASLDKLQEGELKVLWERIQFDFVPDFGEKEEGNMSMLRDDIRDKVFELLLMQFEWISPQVMETSTLKQIEIDSSDAAELSLTLEEEFDIEFISSDQILKWKTVKDIIDYIEDTLECALHDVER